MKKVLFAFIALIFFLAFQTGVISAKEEDQFVDRIVAVVGDEIILLSEVRQQISNVMMARKMDINKTSQSEIQAVFSEVIRDMVNDHLLIEKAKKDSIEVDLRKVDQLGKERKAEIIRQHGSEEAFAKVLQETGLTMQQYLYMLQESSYKYILTETLMQQISMPPTSQEMETWVVANRDSLPEMPEQFKFSHILIYSRVSEERKTEARKKLEAIRQRILDGEDFAELANKYSQDPGSAAKGGYLGDFKRDTMVTEFDNAAFSLDVGEISDIVETRFGYHIIKVENIKGDRIWARHILLLLKPEADDEAKVINQLKQIREDIVIGKAVFEDMAKKYSDDENSNELGGKLQWLTKGQGILPSFIEQTKNIKAGEISEPFKSKFGYHILKLDDYKPAHAINIKDDNQIIRTMVQRQKDMDELERILNKLKAETYIDIRLE